MKKAILSAVLLLVPSFALSLTDEESKLIGEWSAGGASYVFKNDGTAVVDSGVCSVNIKWAVKDNQMSVQYITPVKCATKEIYTGRIITEPKTSLLPSETVRIELSPTVTPGGDATQQLTVFGGKSPTTGAVFVRTVSNMPVSVVQESTKDPKCKEFNIAEEFDRCDKIYSIAEARYQCQLRANLEKARCDY